MLQKMHNSDHFFCISCFKKIERLQKKTICTRKMTQLPILEHLDFILLECLIWDCLMLYCCKAFAYNIEALRGVSASERAMSSILSSLMTS